VGLAVAGFAALGPAPVGAVNRRAWAVERRMGYSGWWVTHRPSGDVFAATSKREAKHLIDSGWYERQVVKDLQVKPAGRREWYHDPITDEDHLYTGGMFSWHCDVHERTCSPFTPVTADDVRRMAIRDGVDDDTFVLVSQAVDDRLCHWDTADIEF
jgi:hypothetical protein